MADIQNSTNGEKAAPSQKQQLEHTEDVPNMDGKEMGSAKETTEDFAHPTAAEEAAVVRKLDLRLIPLVFFLYMLSVLDRSNLGNARLAGMEDDIDLTGFRYNWLGTVFYIAYILSQWLLIGWKQFPPHVW